MCYNLLTMEAISVYKWTYQTELGAITIGANDIYITYLKNFDDCFGIFQETDLIKNAFLQLSDYLTGSLRENLGSVNNYV